MSSDSKVGSLVVVGTGIQAVGQLTVETRGHMEQADKVFFLVNSDVSREYLRRLNPNLQDLHDSYATGKDRFTSYLEMIAHNAEVIARELNHES